MCLAGETEYRLVHKKSGKYVLQIKRYITVVDYDKNKTKTKEVWEDLETKEE